MRPKHRIRRVSASLGEGATAVALSLAFFLVFLGLLNIFFPAGTTLGALLRQQTAFYPDGGGTTTPNQIALASLGSELGLGNPTEVAASLASIQNEVKSKSANSIAWRSAQVGMPLYDRDAIQTFKNASAVIVFDDKNHINIGQKSLLIIKRMEADPILREKRSFMVMVEGELSGKIQGSGEESVQVEVAMPTGVARIKSGQGKNQQANFRITSNPDQSATVSVFEGSAEVTIADQTVRVEPNQAATLSRDKGIAVAENLPLPPVPKNPAGGSIYYYRDLPPRIHFSWKSSEPADTYHFALARDSSFKKIVYEDRLGRTGLKHGNLKDGDYYWGVSAIRDGLEGAFSEPLRIRVVRDREPPELRVNFPPEIVTQDRYVLKGSTEPGANVFVGGKRVRLQPSGEFEEEFRLRPGVNVIVVESVDQAGNVAYHSRLVNGKF